MRVDIPYCAAYVCQKLSTKSKTNLPLLKKPGDCTAGFTFSNCYAKELLETYSVDGIALDWLRHPTVLPPGHRSNFHILSDYMKTIRALLDRYNKHLHLAVRVLPNEQDNLQNGVDVCEWIADGSADVITIENFYIPTNYELPISQWKSSIQKRNTANNNYVLLCSSDWAVSQAAPYVKSSVLPLEKNESAEITIKNNAAHPVDLLWLELSYT